MESNKEMSFNVMVYDINQIASSISSDIIAINESRHIESDVFIALGRPI